MVTTGNANGFPHLSCRQWEDLSFDGTGHKRQVNGVFGNLVCLHYPGEVPHGGGEVSAAASWADYALSPNVVYGTCQRAVWNDFWVSFLVTLFESVIPDA
jgi:hypothetical protein